MYSNEHKKYLKKLRKSKLIVRFFQLLIIALFIIMWQLLADLKLINVFISSSPKACLDTLIALHNTNDLYQHIFITIYETFISFILGTLIGIVVAIILWWNKLIAKIVDPYLTVLNSLPKVAFGPIIIIWVGANMNSIVLMSLLISTVITIINVYNGFNETDSNKIKLLQSFKAKKFQILTKLILPSNFYTIISALKINVSMSLIGVIMGEFLVSKKGIGYLIMYGSQVFNLNLVITGIIILAAVSVIMYYFVSFIEKKLTKNYK